MNHLQQHVAKNKFAFFCRVDHDTIGNTMQNGPLCWKIEEVCLANSIAVCMGGWHLKTNKHGTNELQASVYHSAEALRAEMPVWATGTHQGKGRLLKTRCQHE